MSSLEELIAFNDEVAALVRAGVPIDLGLSQLSHDPDSAKNQINAAVTRRVQSGASLQDAVSEDDSILPPKYQSVVSAGLRCGQLPAALEAVSRYSQPALEVRQTLRSALVYFFFICLLAYLLFVGACLFLWPAYDPLFAESDSGATFPVMAKVREWLPFWFALPLVLLVALLVSSFRSSWPPGRLWSWLPGFSTIATDQRCATTAEVLALLVEHEVPLDEAFRLAVRTSSEGESTFAVGQMPSAVVPGQPLSQDIGASSQLPPFLRWALTSSTDGDNLARTLRLAASTYRHRAQRRAEWLRVMVPTLTCVVLGGTVTLLYCLSIVVPFIQLIRALF